MRMAKKNEMFNIGKRLKVSDVIGRFDKNEDDAYIIIVDNEEYLFEEYADNFLGGSIEIHAIDEE